MGKTGNQDGVQTGYVSTAGGKIWYKAIGKDRSGIPLLAIHGGPGATHDYLEPLEALANERPVIFYDQLDCGNSEKTDKREFWTVGCYREELHRLRKALGLQRLYLLGQS